MQVQSANRMVRFILSSDSKLFTVLLPFDLHPSLPASGGSTATLGGADCIPDGDVAVRAAAVPGGVPEPFLAGTVDILLEDVMISPECHLNFTKDVTRTSPESHPEKTLVPTP